MLYVILSSKCCQQPFLVIAFLRRFWQTCLFCHELGYPVFTSLDFTAVIFLQSKVVPALNLKDKVSVFMSPIDKVAHFTRGTEFPYHHHLQLSGLLCWYSNPLIQRTVLCVDRQIISKKYHVI
jgi:hypothetical protein